MDEALEGLEPESVWNYFDKIRQIPRCSKNEAKIVEFIENTAKELELKVMKDQEGNIVIVKPASPGYENHPGVCLQGHLDMVGEKNADVEHDFSSDPIQLRREGEYIMAKGTTLGADNGIGCAILLAISEEKELKHPPLEMLFTVDEETGMTGASKMTKDFIRHRKLINVDSEELGTIYIGCAGGGDTSLRFPLGAKSQATGTTGVNIAVKGLKGGHSGVDIHLGRTNAIKCLARVLNNILLEQKIRLVDITGGNKRNAIPREAQASVLVEDTSKVEDVIKKLENELLDEFEGIEDNIEIQGIKFEGKQGYSEESTMKLITLLCALPHGYLAFNPHIPDLVDTSTNLATVSMEGDEVIIGANTRSSINSAIENVRNQIVATGELAGAQGIKSDAYPSWKPNMNSELLSIAKGVYKNKFASEPEIKAIHAGLETSIIGAHFPGMDMISIGPQIEYPHSPDERVQIASIKTFWEYIVALLEKL
ncbi:MAG: aminoacyl-histidine dipeptidase [Methanomassiliicoccales archaeon]|nr:MAG: aminoacyl-histidine dipeptidase [Methanomassiliicoccales archaeon]